MKNKIKKIIFLSIVVSVFILNAKCLFKPKEGFLNVIFKDANGLVEDPCHFIVMNPENCDLNVYFKAKRGNIEIEKKRLKRNLKLKGSLVIFLFIQVAKGYALPNLLIVDLDKVNEVKVRLYKNNYISKIGNIYAININHFDNENEGKPGIRWLNEPLFMTTYYISNKLEKQKGLKVDIFSYNSPLYVDEIQSLSVGEIGTLKPGRWRLIIGWFEEDNGIMFNKVKDGGIMWGPIVDILDGEEKVMPEIKDYTPGKGEVYLNFKYIGDKSKINLKSLLFMLKLNLIRAFSKRFGDDPIEKERNLRTIFYSYLGEGKYRNLKREIKGIPEGIYSIGIYQVLPGEMEIDNLFYKTIELYKVKFKIKGNEKINLNIPIGLEKLKIGTGKIILETNARENDIIYCVPHLYNHLLKDPLRRDWNITSLSEVGFLKVKKGIYVAKDLFPGNYDICFLGNWYMNETVKKCVKVKDGESVYIKTKLNEGGKVIIEISNFNRIGAKEVKIELNKFYDDFELKGPEKIIKKDGVYEFDRLKGGKWKLHIKCGNKDIFSKTIYFKDHQKKEIKVKL